MKSLDFTNALAVFGRVGGRASVAADDTNLPPPNRTCPISRHPALQVPLRLSVNSLGWKVNQINDSEGIVGSSVDLRMTVLTDGSLFSVQLTQNTVESR